MEKEHEKRNFEELINSDNYQVFLFTCPAKIPINFARHPWFVCTKDKKISRWEIFFRENGHNSSVGKHVHLNYLPPFSGVGRIPFVSQKFLSNATLLGYVEGGENSLAKKVFDFIEKSGEVYPYRDRYFLSGPNSNTYAQWVLDHFPDFKIKLPWNCFGKNYLNGF